MYLEITYEVSASCMVGKLAGWLTWQLALLNWVSIFQNLMGGSSMISVMLHDHVFPVAWFSMWMKCPLYSIQTIQYPGLHLKSHLSGCLFLKYTQSPT